MKREGSRVMIIRSERVGGYLRLACPSHLLQQPGATHAGRKVICKGQERLNGEASSQSMCLKKNQHLKQLAV